MAFSPITGENTYIPVFRIDDQLICRIAATSSVVCPAPKKGLCHRDVSNVLQ
jgi:hypothetical protein